MKNFEKLLKSGGADFDVCFEYIEALRSKLLMIEEAYLHQQLFTNSGKPTIITITGKAGAGKTNFTTWLVSQVLNFWKEDKLTWVAEETRSSLAQRLKKLGFSGVLEYRSKADDLPWDSRALVIDNGEHEELDLFSLKTFDYVIINTTKPSRRLIEISTLVYDVDLYDAGDEAPEIKTLKSRFWKTIAFFEIPRVVNAKNQSSE